MNALIKASPSVRGPDEDAATAGQRPAPKPHVDGFAMTGDAFVRLEGVVAHVLRAFDTPEQAEIWLWSPNPALKGAIPIVEARTEKGTWNVHAVLGRFEHGVHG